MYGWWKFSAYNTQAEYGYGSSADADKYRARLNTKPAHSDTNRYQAEFLGETDADAWRAIGREGGEKMSEMGCNLDDELRAIADQYGPTPEGD